VRELVVVVSDLYLPQETPERQVPQGVALPGLQQVSRFGSRARLAGGGWRQWVAQWLLDGSAADWRRTVAASADHGVGATSAATASATPTVSLIETVAVAPTATVAAMALPVAQRRMLAASGTFPCAWMATPVHLLAGLSSVHLDRRGILHLSEDDLTTLAADFQRIFHDSGFALQPLASGDFLLFGAAKSAAGELEPARFLGSDVAEARQHSVNDPTLRRLSAEIEMWLHDHRVNDSRARRGELPVTGLWLWGGGPVEAPAAESQRGAADIALGRDAYLQGLLTSMGQQVRAVPSQLADVFDNNQADRAVIVIEIASMLQSAPAWTFFDALAQIDRAFLQPAVQAVRSAQLERLHLLANDWQLTLRRRDHWKFWRPSPTGLTGLQ
jgi:hypothetical protein